MNTSQSKMTLLVREKTNSDYSGNKDVLMITKKTMVALATLGAVSFLSGAGNCLAATQTEYQTDLTVITMTESMRTAFI